MRVGGKLENVVCESLEKKLTVGFKMLITNDEPPSPFKVRHIKSCLTSENREKQRH